MVEYTGWLLDLYDDEQDGVVLWLLDDAGPRRRLTQSFPVTFYAGGPAEELRALWRWLRAAEPAVRLSRAEREDVFARRTVPLLAVEVERPTQLTRVFQQVQAGFPQLTYADADVPLALRYAAAGGVGVLSRCRVTTDGCGRVQAVAALDSPWELQPHNPPLRVLRLAPDVAPAHDEPRALLVEIDRQHWRLPLRPARPLLVNLQAILHRCDPDVLLTRWGDTWLLPRLLELSTECGLPLALNREEGRAVAWRRERSYFSYGQIVYRGQQVLLSGRWHLDTHNALLWDDYDLEGVLESARVTGLPVQTAARVSPGTGISAIQMRTALQRGTLVPWQKQQLEYFKPAAELFSADQGGLIYQPLLGLHRNVGEIDFVSMYPAIMVHFNISPETIQPGGPAELRVPALGLTVDAGRRGLVPQALAPLLEKRVALKKWAARLPPWDPRRKPLQQRASALKWLLVTCFGYLGYKNARFGRIEAHQAVTAYGREALLRAREAAEDLGFEALHLYVDGLWIQQPGKDRPQDFEPVLAEVERRTGLPIALDGIYRWVVFLPSRQNAERPVASRYFGVFQDGSIKVRGIEARRRDTPPFIAAVQMELVRALAAAPDPYAGLPAAVSLLRRRLAELRAGRVAREDLLVAQKLSRKLEDYRTPSPAARAAQQLAQVGKTVRPGQRVCFLLTPGEPGVQAWDVPADSASVPLDLPRYRVLLLRAAVTVLQPFGWSELELTAGWQPALPQFQRYPASPACFPLK